MVLVEEQDIVAGLERHTTDDDVVRLRGVAHDGDLVVGGADVARDSRSRVSVQSVLNFSRF